MIATIVNNQWFSESPLPLNESIHWYQWNGIGFLVWQPLVPMEWRWFSMVCNHWSNDGMVTIHRCGLKPDHQMKQDIFIKPLRSFSKNFKKLSSDEMHWNIFYPETLYSNVGVQFHLSCRASECWST